MAEINCHEYSSGIGSFGVNLEGILNGCSGDTILRRARGTGNGQI
jgi:hypothetical protein